VKQGDIYRVPQQGESSLVGDRYVLVVSATAFNESTKLAIVCPINREINHQSYGFFVEARGGLTTSITSGIVNCGQPFTINLAANRAVKTDAVEPDLLVDILARIQAIFD
jgi:mRNA-degrading endonuclease toxin of MazEF toxin-antitoxin module